MNKIEMNKIEMNKIMGVILMELATRQRNTHVFSVDSALRHVHGFIYDVKRSDVIDCFRALEKDAMGVFVPGRHGAKSRFKWQENANTAYYRYFGSQDSGFAAAA